MRLFTLTPGRTGSTTLFRAFSHSKVYSAGQQTNWGKTGTDRFAYPDMHIESDARLLFFAHELAERYVSEETHWVVMRRPVDEVVTSYARRRAKTGIVHAFGFGILGMRDIKGDEEWDAVARTFVSTAYSIIDAFVESRDNVHNFRLGHAKEDFSGLWRTLGAGSGLDNALREWDIAHNASENKPFRGLNWRRW